MNTQPNPAAEYIVYPVACPHCQNKRHVVLPQHTGKFVFVCPKCNSRILSSVKTAAATFALCGNAIDGETDNG